MIALFASVARAWHWLTTSRYTRLLEAEAERLRAENVALRASLFGMQGVPGQRYREFLAEQISHGSTTPAKAADGTVSLRPPSELAKAIRRPPWPVTRRKLEIEDARRAYQAVARDV